MIVLKTTSLNFYNIFSDDHLLMKWNLVTTDSQKVCELPAEVFPIDFHSFSRNANMRKQGLDQMLITSSDGW